MSTPAKFATQEEFQRLTIRVEVLSVDVHRLGLAVGDIAEDLAELREELHVEIGGLRTEMNSRFEQLTSEMNSRFEAMGKVIADGHAALLSAVLALGQR